MTYRSGFVALLLLLSANLWSESSSVDSVSISAPDQDTEIVLAEAISLLGGKGQVGSGVKAVEMLASLVNDGNTQAMLWLGRAYRDGLAGVEKDLTKAFNYFKMAAGKDGNDIEAQYELGKAYFMGEGTDRNLIAAYMWTSLSTGKKSDVTEKAEEQKSILANMLTKEQLETANTLIKQMKMLYLDQ